MGSIPTTPIYYCSIEEVRQNSPCACGELVGSNPAAAIEVHMKFKVYRNGEYLRICGDDYSDVRLQTHNGSLIIKHIRKGVFDLVLQNNQRETTLREAHLSLEQLNKKLKSYKVVLEAFE